MKKLVLLISLMVYSFTFSQNLVVDYKQTRHLNTSGQTLNESQKMVIKTYSKPSYFKLFVQDGLSLFEKQEVIDNSSRKYKLLIVGLAEVESTLTNFKEQTQIKKVTFSMKEFWVSRDLSEKLDWKIEKDESIILGFKCRKAVAETPDEQTITAWYTNKLPFQMGPMDYYGLPGLILKVKSHPKTNPEQYIETVAIEINETDKSIDESKFKNKDVLTEEDFEKTTEEMMERRREMRGQGVDRD